MSTIYASAPSLNRVKRRSCAAPHPNAPIGLPPARRGARVTLPRFPESLPGSPERQAREQPEPATPSHRVTLRPPALASSPRSRPPVAEQVLGEGEERGGRVAPEASPPSQRHGSGRRRRGAGGDGRRATRHTTGDETTDTRHSDETTSARHGGDDDTPKTASRKGGQGQ